tara:strand:+ start:20474 stop:20665 length:192 start_codon:yes stop_codon:yes gene_type:complete
MNSGYSNESDDIIFNALWDKICREYECCNYINNLPNEKQLVIKEECQQQLINFLSNYYKKNNI